MKKFISNIIAIIMIITTINIPLATAESNVNYPPEGNKCGYIFSLKETPDFDITNDDIIVISADANVYVSKTIKAIKAIEDKVDINFISIRKMIEIAIPDPDNMNLRCLLNAVAIVPTLSLFAILFCSLLNSSSNWSSLSSFIR